MTSDDPKAEETCDALLKTAFETDSENVEALICLSSFRLSQQRPGEAKDAAMKAWLLWKDIEDGRQLCALAFTSLRILSFLYQRTIQGYHHYLLG